MIKAIIPANLQQIYNFIDNRMTLHMAQKKLKEFDSMQAGLGLDAIQKVDNTVFYLEKGEARGSLAIYATEKRSSKPKVFSYGMALRAKSDGTTELFIDDYLQAIQKSLVPRPKSTRARTIVGIAVLALMVVLMIGAAVVLTPILILAIITTVIAYPFLHIKRKIDFKRNQRRMDAIVSIFADEFTVSAKADSGDWVNFWGVIKSKTSDVLPV